MYVGQNHNDLLTKIEKLDDPFLDGKRTILEETRKHKSKKVVNSWVLPSFKRSNEKCRKLKPVTTAYGRVDFVDISYVDEWIVSGPIVQKRLLTIDNVT
jgi:hypothetical protein